MAESRDHWESIYATRSSREVSWYEAAPRVSLEMIAGAGMGPDAPVIDVGGGASVLVDHLLARGFQRVAVLDLAENALRESRRRLGPLAARVEWYAQDVTSFAAPCRFRVWHDRAVFHFLTRPVDREHYGRALRRGLALGGAAIIATFAPGGPPRCSGLEVVQYDAARLAAELGADFRLDELREECHRTPSGAAQPFTWCRFTRIA